MIPHFCIIKYSKDILHYSYQNYEFIDVYDISFLEIE
jgi:hypothetical protein